MWPCQSCIKTDLNSHFVINKQKLFFSLFYHNRCIAESFKVLNLLLLLIWFWKIRVDGIFCHNFGIFSSKTKREAFFLSLGAQQKFSTIIIKSWNGRNISRFFWDIEDVFFRKIFIRSRQGKTTLKNYRTPRIVYYTRDTLVPFIF